MREQENPNANARVFCTVPSPGLQCVPVTESAPSRRLRDSTWRASLAVNVCKMAFKGLTTGSKIRLACYQIAGRNRATLETHDHRLNTQQILLLGEQWTGA